MQEKFNPEEWTVTVSRACHTCQGKGDVQITWQDDRQCGFAIKTCPNCLGTAVEKRKITVLDLWNMKEIGNNE